jgi:hypothetical protein
VFRASRLKELFGASDKRWGVGVSWWLEAFPASRFWQSQRGRFMPAVDETALPLSLVERFGRDNDEDNAAVALLALLHPISTRPGLQASAS